MELLHPRHVEIMELARDEGAAAKALFAEMRAACDAMAALPGEEMRGLRDALSEAVETLDGATDWLLARVKPAPHLAAAGASPYLRLFGTVAGGWLMARSALAASRRLAANGEDSGFLETKLATARFYGDNVLPQASGLAAAVTRGSESALALDEAQL